MKKDERPTFNIQRSPFNERMGPYQEKNLAALSVHDISASSLEAGGSNGKKSSLLDVER